MRYGTNPRLLSFVYEKTLSGEIFSDRHRCGNAERKLSRLVVTEIQWALSEGHWNYAYKIPKWPGFGVSFYIASCNNTSLVTRPAKFPVSFGCNDIPKDIKNLTGRRCHHTT